MENLLIMIPCYNEEVGIGATIDDCRKYAPDAQIIVYDNASTDATAAKARSHGAEVKYVPLRGKGNVVRAMFTDACGRTMCMTDGDNTYSFENYEKAEQLIRDGCDMVIGYRHNYQNENTQMFHSFGNTLVDRLVSFRYHTQVRDVMSGLRMFSPRFTRMFIPTKRGFEIETEMTLFALDHHMKIGYVDTTYTEREKGDPTKTKAIIDGSKIVRTIVMHRKKV